MAAHDTLTSSLTSFVWFLCANPEWQDRLRAEVRSLGLNPGEPLPYDRLGDLPLTEMAYKEALRLIPPVPVVWRCAMRDTVFAGYKLPAGSRVNVNMLFTHHMPEVWPEPERFDPYRFTHEASLGRHKFAYLPFGGGRIRASACISRTCRRSVLPTISCRRRTSLSLEDTNPTGNSGPFPAARRPSRAALSCLLKRRNAPLTAIVAAPSLAFRGSSPGTTVAFQASPHWGRFGEDGPGVRRR